MRANNFINPLGKVGSSQGNCRFTFRFQQKSATPKDRAVGSIQKASTADNHLKAPKGIL